MFKTIKGKLIFVVIFSVICIIITSILVMYKRIDIKYDNSEETSKTLNSIFSDEAAHSKHVSNYYSEVYSIRENIRKAIQDEKINVNLEDVFTAFDKSIIAREHLHGYTYAQMDKIRYSIMRLFP